MHILHTVLFTLPYVLTRRICLTIKSFFSKWSLSLFSWLCVIQRRYCKEKLDDNHSLESKGLTLFSKWKGFISHLHRPLNKYWTVDEIIFYMLFKLALFIFSNCGEVSESQLSHCMKHLLSIPQAAPKHLLNLVKRIVSTVPIFPLHISAGSLCGSIACDEFSNGPLWLRTIHSPESDKINGIWNKNVM